MGSRNVLGDERDGMVARVWEAMNTYLNSSLH